MIRLVARAIGEELCARVVFVGGCSTGLLISDAYTQEQIRHTEDVDVIVQVSSRMDWHTLQEQLRERGFREDISPNNANPVCTMRFQGLRVDFMPDDEAILGFTNRWYRDAYENATRFSLGSGQHIRLIRPEYFVATKLEAYLGRGNNDPLSSHDIEDILLLLDGRPTLIEEVHNAPVTLRQYIAGELCRLKQHYSFEHALSAVANGDTAREDYLYQRLERLLVR